MIDGETLDDCSLFELGQWCQRLLCKSLICEDKPYLVNRRSDLVGNWLVLRQPDAMNQILESGVAPHIVISGIHL